MFIVMFLFSPCSCSVPASGELDQHRTLAVCLGLGQHCGLA